MNRKELEKMRKEAEEVLRHKQDIGLNIIESEIWRFLHNLIVSILEEEKRR